MIFGPYEVDAGRKTIMRSVTGFEQAEAPHIAAVRAVRVVPHADHAGLRPERRRGRFAARADELSGMAAQRVRREERSCQSCHMPKAKGPVRASSVLGDARDTLARHLFVGGNAFMVRMLNRYRAELGVAALPAELEATADATMRQLQDDTATLDVSAPRLDWQHAGLRRRRSESDRPQVSDRLSVSSRLAPRHRALTRAARRCSNRAPSTTTGAIAGNDSDADPLTFEPHYEEITRPDEVQIYEPILGDRASVPTTGLLTATQYLKDNRLLPRGFDKATAPAEVGVFGGAAGDADFTGDGDRVRYGSRGAGGAAVHGRSGAAIPVDRLPVGAQPRALRRAEPQAVRLLLPGDVLGLVGDPRLREGHDALAGRRRRRRSFTPRERRTVAAYRSSPAA